MVKTIQMGDRSVNFNTSFAWTFIYKAQFGRDAAKFLIPIVQTIMDSMPQKEADSADTSDENVNLDFIPIWPVYEQIGFTGLVEIVWCAAKLADKTIPEPLEWVLSFGDDFEANDLVLELLPAILQSCFATKKYNPPNRTAATLVKK